MINNKLYSKYIEERPLFFPAIMHIRKLNKINKDLLRISKKSYEIESYFDNKVTQHFFYKRISLVNSHANLL